MVSLANVYYIVVLAWGLHYLFATLAAIFGIAFGGKLPWTTCGNDWNTANCASNEREDNGTSDSALEYWE